jgi:4-aminobutyrate aminotransferase-like enzyme
VSALSHSQAITERLRRLEGGGLRTFLDPEPLVWDRAKGVRVFDADGNCYIDLYGGFAVAATGHGHPKVVQAIRDQAALLMHCPSASPSRVRAEFLEALAGIAPPGLTRFLPAVTGAMANELALLIARRNKPGAQIVTFSGSYFGRSIGTVGLAGKARYRDALGIPAAAHFVPFPFPLRMGPQATDETMIVLERLTGSAGGVGPVAAVILEPIQGNGGTIIPPPDFLPRLREFCDRQDAMLIIDEIQSGCGRTGKMWAFEHANITPDLVTVGKGIGGGVAVAAVMGSERSMRLDPDSFTSTFLTNNLNLAAAVAAIGVMREERLAERAARLARPCLERLRGRLHNIPGVAEIRGIGLWQGIELVLEDGKPDSSRVARIVTALRRRGYIVGKGGYDDNVVKLSPPLVIAEEELMAGLDAVCEMIAEA